MIQKRNLSKGKRIDTGEEVTGYYVYHEPPLQCIDTEKSNSGKHFIVKTGFADWNMPRRLNFYQVDPETVHFVAMPVIIEQMDEADGLGDFIRRRCPNCEAALRHDRKGEKIGMLGANFCKECGQFLLWTENNEKNKS